MSAPSSSPQGTELYPIGYTTRTKVFLISHRFSWGKPDNVYDLTDQIEPFNTIAEFDMQSHRAASKLGSTPYISVERQSSFSRSYNMVQRDDEGHTNTLAVMNPPIWSNGATKYTFPDASPNSSHPITMKPVAFIRHNEEFVQNSVPYIWIGQTRISSFDMSLYKQTQHEKEKVLAAKYHGRLIGSSGVLVVDEREVDGLVALMTCLAMLKKRGQRARQRSL